MWINVKDQYPEEGQKVIYYFEPVGIWRGQFYISDPHPRIPDSGGLRCFGGSHGFLCEDVTHWMPDEGQDLRTLPIP